MISLEELMGEIGDALLDNAERFTCLEADAIYRAFKAIGSDNGVAVEFMASHVAGDEHRACL